MRWLLDVLYLIVLGLSAPLWLYRLIRTGKWRSDWAGRFGAAPRLAVAPQGRVLLHAVSVGEVNAIRLLVDRLAEAGPDGTPGLDVVIATTTNTGFARATALFGGRHAVVRYPLDFSWAVSRFLGNLQPDAVGLVELEVWPNFTGECRRREIPVCIINGRLSARSAARYARVKRFIAPSLRRLACVAVQDEVFGKRFIELGVERGDILVTQSMKWDTAEITDDVRGADELARELGIDRSRPLVVAGSTAPDEHALLNAAVPADVQLLCAPRRPEWFDDAAEVLSGCRRRTRPVAQDESVEKSGAVKGGTGGTGGTTRFLLDTIGELRQAYALADVVVVGRSFGSLHGSDMMEPIALGKPVVIGPAVEDFISQMEALRAGGGIVQCTRAELPAVIAELLSDVSKRRGLAVRGRSVIRAQQGATDRHAALLRGLAVGRERESKD
jgi:3-deoxy-D-manno-octulosonic-acid transferase